MHAGTLCLADASKFNWRLSFRFIGFFTDDNIDYQDLIQLDTKKYFQSYEGA